MPQPDLSDDFVLVIDHLKSPDAFCILEKKFEDILKFNNRNVILDMNSIYHLDSLLLSLLIRFRNRLYSDGRELHLANCSENVIAGIRRAALEDYFLV